MKDRALGAGDLLSLQILHRIVRAGLADERKDLLRMSNARGNRDGVARASGHQNACRIHHGGEVEVSRSHGLTLDGARIDDAPLDRDALSLEGILEHAALLHDDVLKVEGRLHIGNGDALGHRRGGKRRAERNGERGDKGLEFHVRVKSIRISEERTKKRRQ